MNRLVIHKTSIWPVSSIFLISVVFGYIAGFRPFGIGHDFQNYQFFYDEIRPNDEISYFRYEPGFVFLAASFKYLSGLDYTYFAAFLMTISLMMKFSVLKQLNHPILAVIFYLCVSFPLHENTQIRIAFAIALLFLATVKMFEKRWILFAVLLLLATTFHTASALGAIVLAAANFMAKYRLRYGILFISLTAILISGVLTTALDFFVQLNPLLREGDMDSARPNLFSGTNIATALFLLSSLFSGSLKDHRSRTFFLVVCGGLAVFFVFISVPVLAHRLKEVLMVFMTFIAFEYRITKKTTPQAFFATALMVWSIYSALASGLFSDF